MVWGGGGLDLRIPISPGPIGRRAHCCISISAARGISTPITASTLWSMCGGVLHRWARASERMSCAPPSPSRCWCHGLPRPVIFRSSRPSHIRRSASANSCAPCSLITFARCCIRCFCSEVSQAARPSEVSRAARAAGRLRPKASGAAGVAGAMPGLLCSRHDVRNLCLLIPDERKARRETF